MQHEGIGVGAAVCREEGHALGHEPGDEGDVAGEPVELGDDDGAVRLSGGVERGAESRPTREGVAALAGLGLGMLGEKGDAFGLGDAVAKVGESFRVLDLKEETVRAAVESATSVKALYESAVADDYAV